MPSIFHLLLSLQILTSSVGLSLFVHTCKEEGTSEVSFLNKVACTTEESCCHKELPGCCQKNKTTDSIQKKCCENSVLKINAIDGQYNIEKKNTPAFCVEPCLAGEYNGFLFATDFSVRNIQACFANAPPPDIPYKTCGRLVRIWIQSFIC